MFKSTSQSLALAISTLLALVLAGTALAWHQERQLSSLIERLTGVDPQRIERLSKVNDHANDAARHLSLLLATPRNQRTQAYSQLDASHQLLDRAIADLAALADRAERAQPARSATSAASAAADTGANNQSLRTIQTLLARYRLTYQQSANLIEADELAAAQKNLTEVTGLALTHLIMATQAVSQAEQQKTTRHLAGMAAELKHQRTGLWALASAGLVLAGVLGAWVLRKLTSPQHRTAHEAPRSATDNKGAVTRPASDPEADEDDDAAADTEAEAYEAVHVGGSDAAQAHAAAGDQVLERRQEQALDRAPEQAPVLPSAQDFDILSGLSRRERFVADQGTALLVSAASGQSLALLCFDIEQLKSINALLGFEAGDEAITLTAQRALTLVGPSSDLARLGGGTFGAALWLQEGESAVQRAQAFHAAMAQAAPWQGHTLELRVTVGVAAAPEHGDTAQALLRHAELALFEAKRTRCAVGRYNPGIEAARLSHLSLLADLQQAMDRHELVPFLQPKWCTRSQRVVGAEALVRWQHPQRGWVMPAEFIPFAERTGRIGAVTRYMLQACTALLQNELRSGLHLAVNISAVDLRNPQFVPYVQHLLGDSHLAPNRLLLEVAERGLLGSGDDPLARLAELRALGVGVAIDDFGSGQSPLGYLQRLPASELKIDRGLVTDADSSAGRQQLLRSIIDMAHSLGLVVTAEGVETDAERQLLTDAGCDLLQGYLIGKPVPVAEFVRRYLAGAQTHVPPPTQAHLGHQGRQGRSTRRAAADT